MSNYIDSLSDIPKTTRYRGKAYSLYRSFHLRTLANKAIKDTQSKNKSKDKVANFFTVTRTYWVKNAGTTSGWKGYYAVYWRAVYLKAPLKKRLAEIRAGHRPSDMGKKG
jgi:hypothetical protein